MKEGAYYADINEKNQDREEAKYDIFGDDSDLLISIISSSQLKEIVNLIKNKALMHDETDKKSNYVA